MVKALKNRLGFRQGQAEQVVAASTNEALGKMLGANMVGPELIGEAHKTKMVSERRAREMLAEKMGVSKEVAVYVWESLPVQAIEARISARISMAVDGDATAVTDHMVATTANIYGVPLLDADRMAGVISEGERDAALVGVRESERTVWDWKVQSAVMGRLGRTSLAARNWVQQTLTYKKNHL